MGPLFVLLGWLIIGLLAGAGYLALGLLGRKSPVAAQLKQVMPAFAVAVVGTLALLVMLYHVVKFFFPDFFPAPDYAD